MRTAGPVIEANHYSHSVFGITSTWCFAVYFEHDIVGAAIFGLPAGRGVLEKYADGGNLLELRRFVLLDCCPRNSESRVLGVMFRMLKARGIDVILSYADPAHGHEGVIYRALGFEYRKTTAKRKHYVWRGKTYPDRNVHQTNFPFHLQLREAIADGTASPVHVKGKHIFVKRLS